MWLLMPATGNGSKRNSTRHGGLVGSRAFDVLRACATVSFLGHWTMLRRRSTSAARYAALVIVHAVASNFTRVTYALTLGRRKGLPRRQRELLRKKNDCEHAYAAYVSSGSWSKAPDATHFKGVSGQLDWRGHPGLHGP